jgi:2-methylisocitrate lyase-like PEP mutase family enzyme
MQGATSLKTTTRLRAMMADNDIHVAPGAFDGLTARLVEQAGFGLIYASGGAIARSCGYPDIGLLSLSEVQQRLEQMVEVSSLPIIADADTGFGNAANARRTLRTFERIGVAALHIEDQTFPKRCGHLDDKTLVSTTEMVHKIRVIKDAQTDPHFVVIARTDAIASESFEAALERSQAYLQAGADVIFVEAPQTIEQIEQIATRIAQPKLINMFHSGKTPLVPKARLLELGYKFIIIPSDLQRIAIKAWQRVLEAISRDGDSASLKDDMVPFAQREEIVGTREYLSL